MAGPIRIAILANASQAKAELQQVTTISQRVGAGFRKMALPAVAALGAIGAASLKATQAAADDAAAQSRLAQSLKTAAGATTAQVAATEAWIVAQGKSLGVTDDELRPAIAKLATATGDVAKAQKLASLAMNISAGSGASLEQVTSALAKAQNGSTLGLKKFGVSTTTAAGQTKSLAKLTDELASKYRGAAAAASETAVGQQKKLQVQLGELQEEIGQRLLPVLTRMAEVGLKAVEWIGKNQGKVVALVAVLAGLAATVLAVNAAMSVYAAGQTIASAATVAFTLAQRAATAASLGTRIGLAALAVQTVATAAVTKAAAIAQAALNAVMLANPVTLLIVAIAALVAGLVIAYQRSETFRAIVDKVFAAIKTVIVGAVTFVVDFVKNNWPKLLILLTGPIGLAVALIVKNWDKIKAATRAAWEAVKSIVTGVVNAVKAVVTTVFNAYVTVITGVWNKIKAATSTAWNALKDIVSKAVTAVREFVTTGFDKLVGFVSNLPGRISSAAAGLFDGIKSAFTSAINFIIDGWNGLSFSLPSVDVPGFGKVGGFTLSTPNIPRLARGGVTTGETLAVVGDNPGGREAIIPLDRYDLSGASDLAPLLEALLVAVQVQTAAMSTGNRELIGAVADANVNGAREFALTLADQARAGARRRQ